MPQLNEAELKKQIAQREFARVYCLYGEEAFLIQKYAERIVEKAVSGLPDFNLQFFEGKVSADAIAQAAEALPVMGECKCVVVSNYDAETAGAAETAKLAELLGDPPESCVVLFKQTTVTVNPKKSAKWRAFLKAVETHGCSVCLPRREAPALAKYLCDYAQKRECTLTQADASYLVGLCGNDLTTLNHEMEKLCAYCQGKIDRAAMEAVVVKNTETAGYRLANALLAGQYDTAYQLLDQLFYQREEPVAILSALASAYVDVYRAKAAAESGEQAAGLAEYFDYRNFAFRLQNAARTARKLSLSQLRRSLGCLYEADRALKGARAPGRLILEEAMARLLVIASGRPV